MTWECFSRHDVENLIIINDKLTTAKYIEILQKMGFEREYFFQQDNDPKHKARITMKLLENNDITTKLTSTNPTEHL